MSDESRPEGRAIPAPAHPHLRTEPLPGSRPKPSEEDPEAPRRIAAILSHPSYREADRDVDFLGRDDTRGPRLQLDYMKPEILLEARGIAHSIVVFGSTRIPEPGAARHRVEALRRALAEAPNDPELPPRLAVAERILANSGYYQVARELGERVARDAAASADGRLVVLTGGGPGIMEAANRGAFDAGAETVGLNIVLPHEQYPNPYLTPGLAFRFHYFAIRKLHFLLRARALVAFPGGYGTLDELFEALTLVQTRTIRPVPVVLVGEAWWRRAFDVDFLAAEGVIDAEDRDLFWYAETAREIWDGILRWYEQTGSPLLRRAAPA